MWEDNYFIDNTRKIRDTPEFSSFIGHIITDLNLCMDEGFQKIPEYKALLMKDKLSKTEQAKLKTEKRNIKANFDLGKYSLKLTNKLTGFVPECFATDEWKTKFSNIINYFASK